MNLRLLIVIVILACRSALAQTAIVYTVLPVTVDTNNVIISPTGTQFKVANNIANASDLASVSNAVGLRFTANTQNVLIVTGAVDAVQIAGLITSPSASNTASGVLDIGGAPPTNFTAGGDIIIHGGDDTLGASQPGDLYLRGGGGRVPTINPGDVIITGGVTTQGAPTFAVAHGHVRIYDGVYQGDGSSLSNLNLALSGYPTDPLPSNVWATSDLTTNRIKASGSTVFAGSSTANVWTIYFRDEPPYASRSWGIFADRLEATDKNYGDSPNTGTITYVNNLFTFSKPIAGDAGGLTDVRVAALTGAPIWWTFATFAPTSSLATASNYTIAVSGTNAYLSLFAGAFGSGTNWMRFNLSPF